MVANNQEVAQFTKKQISHPEIAPKKLDNEIQLESIERYENFSTIIIFVSSNISKNIIIIELWE